MALGDIRSLLPETACAAPLAHLSALRITGADAATFLQGQLSNDVNALNQQSGQLTSYNSPKGRVLAFARLLKFADGYIFLTDATIVEAVSKRLGMYVLRSKVNISAVGDIQGMALIGMDAEKILQHAKLPLPSPGGAVCAGELVLMDIPGPAPRIEIYGPKTALPELDTKHANEANLACWDILYHLPRLAPELQDQYVAQHLNLDELNGISFRKGCYTGQEIIARMKYLGKIKKRAFVFQSTQGNPGDALYAANRKVGEIVNAANCNGLHLLLAVTELDCVNNELRVSGENGVPAIPLLA